MYSNCHSFIFKTYDVNVALSFIGTLDETERRVMLFSCIKELAVYGSDDAYTSAMFRVAEYYNIPPDYNYTQALEHQVAVLMNIRSIIAEEFGDK